MQRRAPTNNRDLSGGNPLKFHGLPFGDKSDATSRSANLPNFPPNIIKHYSLDKLVVDGFVYARIKKAWYRLKQSGKIVHNDLVDHLKEI